MTKKILAAVAAACVLFGASANAQTAASVQTDADLRCAVLGLVLSLSQNPEESQAGSAIFVYYVGRVQGREPSLNLETAIVARARSSTGTQLTADQERCENEASELEGLIGNIERQLAPQR